MNKLNLYLTWAFSVMLALTIISFYTWYNSYVHSYFFRISCLPRGGRISLNTYREYWFELAAILSSFPAVPILFKRMLRR
jgi:hypothetical protein